MLIDTTILEPNTIDRIKRWGIWNCPIAQDPDTGATLQVGGGRRRAGRPRRYFIHVPSEYLPAGLFYQEQIGTVTAFYDEDAIQKANARLEKYYRLQSIHEEK